ncbi:hypothetical protein Q31b_34630 [Novipirellula aureliae]|uniref:Uncharacterized protein n=1 Tax=Novipirellula aureliae TaxID=2527966 RepID=A0A5C6DYY5_9BACT|nr:hypothetical protein Q31b_34630 [Novipirellula aureliae]
MVSVSARRIDVAESLRDSWTNSFRLSETDRRSRVSPRLVEPVLSVSERRTYEGSTGFEPYGLVLMTPSSGLLALPYNFLGIRPAR